jgi:hypothetical protein
VKKVEVKTGARREVEQGPMLVQIVFKNSVCTSKQTYFSITEINWLILFPEEIIVVHTENNMKHVNTNVKACGTYSYHWALKGKGIVRFQVLMVASMKFRVFWDVLPCSQVDVDQCFKGVYCLHHHRPYDGGSTHL